MKVKEFLRELKTPCKVEIRENNHYLCDTTTDNKTIELYYNRELMGWYPTSKCGCVKALVIDIKGQ